MAFCVVHTEIADAEHGDAKPRQVEMNAPAKPERQPLPAAHRGKNQCREPKAPGDAGFGRHRAKLKGDRQPGGAPYQHTI